MVNPHSDSGQRLPHVEAIDRALELLLLLADAGPDGNSLGELCAASGMSKATAYRALSTMRTRGFVTQPRNGSYRLGPQSMALGTRQLAGANLVRALRPTLTELARRSKELVHLGSWDGMHVIYLDKVEPGVRAIRVWSDVGQRVPAASTALGRALLGAGASGANELNPYLDALPADRAVTMSRLFAAIKTMRATGFAAEIEENEPGVACIAAALMREGEPIAAISITTLASRMTPNRANDLRHILAAVVPPLLPEGLQLFRPE